jgi:hypothetical protein
VVAKKISRWTGSFSAVGSIILWIVLTFLNIKHDDIDMEPIIKTSLMLLLPSCLFLISLIFNNGIGLLLSTIWFTPVSLYFSFTPGVFKLYGVTLFLYIISTVLMLIHNLRSIDN